MATASAEGFDKFCKAAWAELGFSGTAPPLPFATEGLSECRRATIGRQAEAATFRWEERWVLVGLAPLEPLDAARIQAVRNAVAAMRATDVLLVSQAPIEEPAHEALHKALAEDGAALAVIAGSHSRILIQDAASEDSKAATFSFRRLRRSALREVETAAWSGMYQPETLSLAQRDAYLPQTVKALHPDADRRDADLVTAVAGGSCLLLGPPGAGKTTALMTLAAELARAGGRTAVLVRLGAYRGSLVQLIGEALGAGAVQVSEPETRALLKTGALVVLLDGINEVQDPEAQSALVTEINELTATSSPTSRTRWVVTGRVRDYEASLEKPTVIEKRRWHLEPLSHDLVFKYLVKKWGPEEADRAWARMDAGLREMCRTPLLLSLVLAMKGDAPLSRGALYSRTVDDVLQGDDKRALGREHRTRIAAVWPALSDQKAWRDASMNALTAVASGRRTTVMTRADAVAAIARGLRGAPKPKKVADLLLRELLRRGLLLEDTLGGLRFRHHTFQEFVASRRDLDKRLYTLLPIEWKREGRVPPERREGIRLLASLRSDTAAVIKRLLELGDATLALEVAEDQPAEFARSATIEPIALSLLKSTLGDGFVGQSRPFAQAFVRCSGLLGVTLDELVRRVTRGTPEEVAERTAELYSELGDLTGLQRTLVEAVREGIASASLRWRAASAALNSRDFYRAISLWTKIIEDPAITSDRRGGALGNRGIAYSGAGRFKEAERDYRAAIELDESAICRANLADDLFFLGRLEEAETNARRAIDLDNMFATAHSILANILEAAANSASPDLAEQKRIEALAYREAAVQLAMHDEELIRFLRDLAALQETLNRHDEAIRSYERLLDLSPASDEVSAWKQKILSFRRKVAEEHAKHSDYSVIVSDPSFTRQVLVRVWLDMAGNEYHVESSICWLVRSPPGPDTLVVLLSEPILEPHHLKKAVKLSRGLSPAAQRAEPLMLVTTTNNPLSGDVQRTLAEIRAKRPTGVLTVPELRDAVFDGPGACRRLFDDALSQQENPFESRGFIKVASRFWGRKTELEASLDMLRQGASFGLYGVHKVGKSSLLWQVRHHLRTLAPEVTPLWLELDASVHTAPEFYSRLAHALTSKEPAEPPRNPSPGAPPSIPSALAMRAVLEQFHRDRQRIFAGHRLALILDEYAYLIPDGKRAKGIQGFEEVLGLLKTLVQEGWFLFVPCGRTAALTRQGNLGDVENPFLALFPAKFLAPMPREEHHAMMTGLAREKQRISFSDAALDHLFVESGGHPRFARDLGARLLTHRRGLIEPEDVEWAVSEAAADADESATARAIYENRMSDIEQGVAMAAALSGQGLAYKDAFPAGAAESELMAIRDAIKNLVDTGILLEEKRGGRRTLSHRIGLLRRTLARRAEDLGMEAPAPQMASDSGR
jgi:tetratricopeptide (TPR) repeat protein